MCVISNATIQIYFWVANTDIVAFDNQLHVRLALLPAVLLEESETRDGSIGTSN